MRRFMVLYPLFTVLVFFMAVTVPAVSSAATIVVDTNADTFAEDGVCSLREAIINANNGDQSGSVDCEAGSVGANTIVFDAGLTGTAIVLDGSELPTVTKELSIEGPAPGDSSGIALDGDDSSRIVRFDGDFSAELKDLTLTGGRSTDSLGGGAVRAVDTHLQLQGVVISNNVAEQVGGAGLIMTNGTLVMMESEVSGNTASGSGGGLYLNNVNATVTDSSISDNTVSMWGGALRILPGSSVALINTTLAGNSGGGIAGGIYIANADLSMTNSTVTGSTAGSSVAIYASRSNVTLIHSTVANGVANFDSNPHGITLWGDDDGAAVLELFNSLVVQPEANQRTCSTGGNNSTIVHAGSLSTHDSCTGTATAVTEVSLGPLADNGGPTRTHALYPNSVAIDAAGDCLADHGVSQDQRGQPRPGGDSSGCDVGAYESQGESLEADVSIDKSVTPETADAGETVTFTLTAVNLGPDVATNIVVMDQLPAGYEFVTANASAGTYDPDTTTWLVSLITAGSQETLTIEATVNPAGPYLNTATISADQFDPDPDNNTAESGISLTPPPPGPIVVDTTADIVAEDGLCSLREAIINANANDYSGSLDCQRGNPGADVITFDPSLAGASILLNGSQLPRIVEDLRIEGPIAGNSSGMTLDAGGESRIIYILPEDDDEPVIGLQDLTLTGGATTAGGGAVRAFYADIELTDVTITGNEASGASDGGGVYLSAGTLTMLRSTVDNNFAGGRGGGLMVSNSQLEMTNSTISTNTAAGDAGGLMVNRSTAVLQHATVAFNTDLSSVGQRHGIYLAGNSENPALLQLHGSLVVQHASGDRGCAAASFSSIESSFSMSTDTGCTGSATAVQAIGLGALRRNGGSTRNHSLGTGSVAIDAAGNCVASPGVAEDQRGRPRPGGDSIACDIGAFEDQGDDVMFNDRFQFMNGMTAAGQWP